MDAAAARYGAGHRLLRHDWATVSFMVDYYASFDPTLRKQVTREIVMHIAIDKGLITLRDITLMSDFVRILERRSGPRSILNDPNGPIEGRKIRIASKRKLK
ncbi:MAG: hypothetical protein HQM09_16395 [Candidatus Riflebacteria bacterium]|nr:hypothetical protein [Candidatus Riflebacteria bacterium]